MTGWSGKILRIDLDPGTPIFCLTELWFSLKSTISDILGFSMEAMGTPWDPMGPHGTPWGPMGPMGPMGTHGFSKRIRGGRGSGRQKMWGGLGGAGAIAMVGMLFGHADRRFRFPNQAWLA